jgi:hypothetical protein
MQVYSGKGSLEAEISEWAIMGLKIITVTKVKKNRKNFLLIEVYPSPTLTALN